MTYSIEELDALAVIDPEIEVIWKSGTIQKTDIDYSDQLSAVQQIRSTERDKQSLVARDGVTVRETFYNARDGYQNRLLVFCPASSEGNQQLPLLVHIHGGAGCVGSPEQESGFCQDLVLQLHCVVIAISYRLAPEWKFPVGRFDCIDAVKHISEHATEYGASLSLGFVVGGHSYGASASAVVSLYAEEIGLRAEITGLYLAAGSFVGASLPDEYKDAFRSRVDQRCKNTPVLDQRTAILFGDSYAADRASKWFKACNITSQHPFRSLPCAYFQVCGMDILRDDSLVFRDMLVKNGVDTKLDVYPGAPHLFWEAFGPGVTKLGDRWQEDTREGIGWLLQRT